MSVTSTFQVSPSDIVGFVVVLIPLMYVYDPVKRRDTACWRNQLFPLFELWNRFVPAFSGISGGRRFFPLLYSFFDYKCLLLCH